MMKKLLSTVFVVSSICVNAQTGNIKGVINSSEGVLQGVTISLKGSMVKVKTNNKGVFELKDIPVGEQTIMVSLEGYKSDNQIINVSENETANVVLELIQDYLELDNIVITATRSEVPVYKSPVIVSRINSKTFETTQSLALSEGLNFTPGLRLETNCQNCGFTQVRMNGLEGPYSQVLINSRPIFSALMGVYGLDMLPTGMIDRVEVVRGGGSALYGGNAIAGTINIITKDPMSNSFSIGTNYSFANYKTPDRTLNVNGSIVSEDYNKGMSFYAYNRDRKPWDANGDDFSEMTQLQNSTFGFDAFWNTSKLSKLKINAFNINEFRRGGNKFDLPPHQTDITEQLDHKILGGAVSFEKYSQDLKHKYSIYTSAQTAKRKSYYGGSGRILAEGDAVSEEDLLAINAYGKSKDLSLVGGAQYSYDFNEKFFLLSGTEYQYNDVKDQMPGYNRLIDQQVGTLGVYSQLEIKPTEKLNFLLGARYDHVNINGIYNLDVESFKDKKKLNVFVPRLTAMYAITDNLKARASYSQGYRAPQAFDEDLHIETVGGSASFTKLSQDLKTEKSNSINASLNYTQPFGNTQANIVLEGFYTKLNDVFITADAYETPSGISVLTKRNGAGAKVMGANIEANLAFSGKLNLQLGGTLQKAVYTQDEEIWASEDGTEVITTKNMLRTPKLYGYYTVNYNPVATLTLSLSGVYTGKMDVPHVIDADSEKTVVKNTPSFFEQNLKLAYDFDIKDNCIQVYTGVQNIFNSYQKDFDRGALRDAGYIYGPSRPQTFFIGAKYTLK
ncbi:TonB-dependent receptor domain-containing protein [Capnocytophaga sp. ARDL2]|uniref:TonB-dependent receptor n=1 Tax=Capnocytophaga sp. ARDL2 TaxID=3238809 RepID=UPI003556E36E